MDRKRRGRNMSVCPFPSQARGKKIWEGCKMRTNKKRFFGSLRRKIQ